MKRGFRVLGPQYSLGNYQDSKAYVGSIPLKVTATTIASRQTVTVSGNEPRFGVAGMEFHKLFNLFVTHEPPKNDAKSLTAAIAESVLDSLRNP